MWGFSQKPCWQGSLRLQPFQPHTGLAGRTLRESAPLSLEQTHVL